MRLIVFLYDQNLITIKRNLEVNSSNFIFVVIPNHKIEHFIEPYETVH